MSRNEAVAMSAKTAESFAANRPVFEKVVAPYAYIAKQPDSSSGPGGSTSKPGGPTT